MPLHNIKSAPPESAKPAMPGTTLSSFRLAISMLLTACLGLHTATVLVISFGIPLLPQDAPVASELPYIGAVIAGCLFLLNGDLILRGLFRLIRITPDMESLIAVSTLAAMSYSLYMLLTMPDASSPSFFPIAGITLALTDLGLYASTKAAQAMAISDLHIKTSEDRATDSANHEKKTAPSSSKPHGDAVPFDENFEKSAHPAKTALPKDTSDAEPSVKAPASAAGLATVGAILFAALGSLALLFLGAPLADVLLVAAGILIVACPGAIALCRSLPHWIAADAVFSGGVRLHAKDAFSRAAEVDTLLIGRSILIDPTKTEITDIMTEGLTDETFFSLASSAEADSSHPIATAINERARRIRARQLRASARTEVPGSGVEALAGGASLRVGRGEWLQAQGIKISAELLTRADQLASKGKTVVFVSSNQFAKGLIAFSNKARDGAEKMIQKLKSAGIEPVLLTSDNTRTAKVIAQSLGIAEYRADCTKIGRAKEIQLLKAQGRTVALLDTLDASSSAIENEADYLIAPKGSSPASAEKAHIALTRTNLSPLAPLFTMSRRVEKLTRQNYFWAVIGSLLALPIASGIAYSFGGPLLSPPIALLSMLPGFFAVLINTLRLVYS